MRSDFIPSIHLAYSAAEKLKPEWWEAAINEIYYQANNVNLLSGKNVKEIEEYSNGSYSMKEFKRMFSSDKEKNHVTDDSSLEAFEASQGNLGTDIVYQPLPLLPTKLHSAESVIERTPIELIVEAMDALAWEKKQKDVDFLKNKAEFEAPLQDLSNRMGLGKVDLGSTRYTATPFSSAPYGMDLNEADELQVFIDILSLLAVEAALENVLQSYWDFKSCDALKLMWIKDQLRYGVSCHMAYTSTTTGLPDVDYAFPGEFSCPRSLYPDYRDVPQMIRSESMSVIDMFNKFGDEIGSEEDLEVLINGKGGYCECNKMPRQADNLNQFKVQVELLAVKSVDWIGIVPANKKSKFKRLTTDEDELLKFKGEKRWAQNTYLAYWLKGTNKYFKISKLGYAQRKEGAEQFQGFPFYAYRGSEKSAAEMSIPENKKAQIADMKMQFAILKAKKSGIYMDLKYLRGTLRGLKGKDEYTMKQLINLFLDENIMIGDTEDFDGKNEGQFPPFKEIIGGLRNDIVGYMQIIADAQNKISAFTGINEQLAGQASNPEGLVGMQKLLINGAVNSISYVNRAVEGHCTNLFTAWYPSVKEAVKAGGKRKEAIEKLIGSKKVNLIAALDEIPLHSMGMKVTVEQRELERQEYKNEVFRLKQMGVINTVDDYMLSAIKNPKDRMALLSVKTKQFERKMMQQRQDANEQQQVLVQQQGQNLQAAEAAKTEGDKQKIYAQGDVSSRILQLASQLNLSEKQIDAMVKKSLQDARGKDQSDKMVKTLETKANLENQKPYGE